MIEPNPEMYKALIRQAIRDKRDELKMIERISNGGLTCAELHSADTGRYAETI